MDDNAKHTKFSIIFDDFLGGEDIRCMDLSARAPDFNTIEPVWKAPERTMA